MTGAQSPTLDTAHNLAGDVQAAGLLMNLPVIAPDSNPELAPPPGDSSSRPDDALLHQELTAWMSHASKGALTTEHSTRLARKLAASEPWPLDCVTVDSLLAEVRGGSAQVSRIVVNAWAKDGQVHRLSKLADELLSISASSQPSLETASLMIQLADFLGIVRSARAQKLVSAVQTCVETAPSPGEAITKPLHAALIWTRAGLLLEPCPPDERVLWNNRLRNPDMDWHWETAEARQALSRLPLLLPLADPEVIDLFRQSLPPSWWELYQRTLHPAPAPAPDSSPGLPAAAALPSKGLRPAQGVALIAVGSLLGFGGAMLAVHWSPSATPSTPPLVKAVPIPLPSWSAVQPSPAASPAPLAAASTPHQAPLIRLSLFPAPQPAPPLSPAPLALSLPQASPPPQPAPAPAAPPLPQPSPEVLPEAGRLSAWRVQEIAAIRAEFPAIERLQRTLSQGSFQEAERILRGGSSIAAVGSPSYRALLRWAMVDPPADPQVRRAVTRLFALTPPFSAALPVIEKAAARGEPYHQEIREMAGVLYTASPGPLEEEELDRLRRINE